MRLVIGHAAYVKCPCGAVWAHSRICTVCGIALSVELCRQRDFINMVGAL